MSSNLSSLLVDEKKADEELIASILQPYLRIGKDSGIIIPNQNFSKLTLKNKLIIYCIGRKAAKLNGILREDEALKLDVIATRLNEPLQVLNVTASRLSKKGILDKSKIGWYVSTAKLLNAKTELLAGYKTHKRTKKTRKTKK